MTRTRRVLITGSNGQIGTNLGLRLLEDGYDVRGVDMREDAWSPAIQTIRLDLRSGTSLTAALDDCGFIPDLVVHLAANVKVHRSVKLPELAFENILMTQNVLEYCRAQHAPIVFSSSREVYGNATTTATRFDESRADFAESASPYAASKIAAESLIYSYARCYGLRYLVFRLSNVYGRYDSDLERMERVVPLFIRSIRRLEPVTIFGREKLLDFTYIDDCVEGLRRGVQSLLEGRLANHTINLAYGAGNSLIALADFIGHELGLTPQVRIRPAQAGEVRRYVADIGNARALLGYAPRTGLRQGIGKAVRWQMEWELSRERAAAAA